MCQVVNFKQYGSVAALNQAFGDRWLYIGRANSQAGLAASPLANPFKVRDYGGQPGATLDHYRHWLWSRIVAGDEAVLAALRAVDEGTVLVCWCKPGPCHWDVVQAAAAWVRSRAAEQSGS
ncbi:MAG: DUF4326 domain-containing protein [Chloroflexota bacterium]